MRNNLLGFAATILLVAFACRKSKDCNVILITDSAPGCGGWGIEVNGKKYPSRNVPDDFQQNGLKVCATYSIYDDLALCPCCGGKWAEIKTILKAE